jgi:hypothetical protein
MSTLTSRTLEMLRTNGWSPWVVEQWISIPGHPAGGMRRDLFNFIDVLAVREHATLAVQVCRAGDLATRRSKILEAEFYPAVVAAGWAVEIQAWKKPDAASRRWRVRVVDVVTGEDSGLRLPAKAPAPLPLLELAAAVAP